MNEQRIKELEKEILYHNKVYTEGKPEISDKEYDLLVEELRNLDKDNQVLLKVGAELSYGKKVLFQIPMGSLNKVTFSYNSDGSLKNGDGLDTLRDWQKKYSNEKIGWNMKVDGIAGELVYENGSFLRAANRGNGIEGFDLTSNVLALKSIPMEILNDTINFNGEEINVKESKITIRGEFHIPRSEFQKLIDEGKIGQSGAIVNERNVCSGAMNCMNPKECADKRVHFISYKLYVDDVECDSMSHAQEIVNSFKVDRGSFNWNTIHFENLDAQLIKKIDADRKNYDYRTDGIVLFIDDTERKNSYGMTGLNPNGMVAFKFETEKKETVLRNIIWNPSGLGIIAPVAQFDAIELSETMVSAASLFNYQMIVDRDINIGDTILVEKGGDIIPNIVRVTKHCGSKNINKPDVCPVCGFPTVQEGVHLMCKNPDCFNKQIGRIMCWLSVLEIEQPCQAVIQSLLEKKVIECTSDLYDLTEDDFLKANRTSPMLAKRYYDNIHAVKEVSLEKFLNTLCINGIGMAYYEQIAKKFKTLDKVLEITESDLVGLPRFGESINKKVVEGLNVNRAYIAEMRKRVNVLDYVENVGCLNGLSFCFTGKVSKPRNELEKMVLVNGGKLGSVAKGLSYLVAGEKAGSKLEKAEKCGVKVISESEFYDLIG